MELLQDVNARPWGWRPSLTRFSSQLLERALGVTRATRLYETAQLRDEPLFSDRVLGALDVRPEIEGDLNQIPAAGPLVVVANHPFGAVDGLLVSSIVSRRRPDARCLANRVLDRLPEARREMFLVDTTGGPAAAARNHRPLRAAMSWVRGGGCLCVFPAGVVAHATPWNWTVREGRWHASIARLIRGTEAAVVPCFIEGANSWLFQALGTIHPALRSAWLVRELLRLRGRKVRVHVGAPIAAGEFPREVDRMTAALRERTEALGATAGARSVPRPAVIADTLEDEVKRLSLTQSLTSANGCTVFWAKGAQAPRLVRAIGAAREETFRIVGEGTGQEIDIDEFDRHYVHLCVWDDKANELVGAYRLKYVDGTVAAAPALYTRTLFRFGHALERSLSPALELGRAFVRERYQKQYAPLMLLWSGIGRYLTQHTDARYLFGPVSISAQYSPAARDLIVRFLERHTADRTRSRLVEPLRPVVRQDGGGDAVPSDMAALNTAVTAVDPEGKGVPVLLRHYLKLGARALAFSVDPAFGNTVDALVFVDLLRAPEKLLERYLGSEEARAHLARISSGAESIRRAS